MMARVQDAITCPEQFRIELTLLSEVKRILQYHTPAERFAEL